MMRDVPVPGRVEENDPLASPSGYARKVDITLKKRQLASALGMIGAHGTTATFGGSPQLVNFLRVLWRSLTV
jgi:hypothetical protein